MAQPASNWNAEATDAKGYWVTTPEVSERVDVDWAELHTTSEEPKAKAPAPPPARLPPVRRPAEPLELERLVVAPVQPEPLQALPMDVDTGFEVPEFTLSEKRARTQVSSIGPSPWEILDTYVPDGVEEAETEEVARPPATNVKVFARSKAFTEAISHDLPGRHSHGVSIEGPSGFEREPAPLPSPVASDAAMEAPRPAGVTQVRHEATAAEDLSIEGKRALARAMAAKALAARTERTRDPGSLPPIDELPRSAPVLPPRSKESWGWDEADPLASPTSPTPTPAPRRPSLSVVRSAPGIEDYDDALASPLPAPPRPDVIVPWPLPQVRARIGMPQITLVPELAAIDELDSVSIERVEPEAPLPTAPTSSGSSWAAWLLVALGTLGVLAMAALGSLMMLTVVVVAALA